MTTRVIAAFAILALILVNVPFFVLESWSHAPPLVRFLVGAISGAAIVYEASVLVTGRPPFDQAAQEVDDP